MATATQPISIEHAIKQQNELIRAGELNLRAGTGGYQVIGRMIELRHERPVHGNVPDRKITDLMGLTLDWKHYHNGPVLALDRGRNTLLVVSPVGKLPDIPDPEQEYTQFIVLNGNRMPLRSIPKEMLATLCNTDGSRPEGLDGELEATKMVRQTFLEHASGTFGNFLVVRPVTQVLYKLDGIPGMALIEFKPSEYSGDMPTFLLDPSNGEAHFLGGTFILR